MNVALLDINDCRLRLWTDVSSVESPGYALLSGREYRFGEVARASARLQPRDINNRFWWQLGTASLQPPLGPARHTADLVHAHLLELHAEAGSPEQLLVACPGSMSREQLSLLLGIAQQCPFEIAGLVDRSALLASQQAGQFHLELQLHQALLTELSRDQGRVAALRSTALPGCGLLQLQERLVQQIAGEFIRQTRFDPRHKAESEQSLYDALPGVLSALAEHSEHNCELGGYRARLTRAGLATATEGLITATREAMGNAGGAEGLLLDPLPALLPGIPEAFPVNILAADTAWQAAIELHTRLLGDGEQHQLIDALPDQSGPAAAPAGPEEAPPVPQPTHLLQGSVARPLGVDALPLAGGLSLLPRAGGWQLSGAAAVNGSRADAGQALQSGDVVNVAGEEFRLIEVLADGH